MATLGRVPPFGWGRETTGKAVCVCAHPRFRGDSKTLAALLCCFPVGSWALRQAGKETSHLIPEPAASCLWARQGTEPGSA